MTARRGCGSLVALHDWAPRDDKGTGRQAWDDGGTGRQAWDDKGTGRDRAVPGARRGQGRGTAAALPPAIEACDRPETLRSWALQCAKLPDEAFVMLVAGKPPRGLPAEVALGCLRRGVRRGCGPLVAPLGWRSSE